MNSDGTIAWNKDIGCDGDDNLRTVKESAPGKFVIGGFTWGGAYGDKTDIDRGGTDYWIITLNDRSSSAVNSTDAVSTIDVQSNAVQKPLNSSSFSVYPNPAKDVINIKITGAAVMLLMNQSGKIITSKLVETNATINVNNLPAGVYFLKNTATGVSEKIMIAK